MTYIPKAVCIKCKTILLVKTNDIILNVKVKGENRHYYSVSADLYCCPVCQVEIIMGFAMEPFCHNVQLDENDRLPQFENQIQTTIEM